MISSSGRHTRKSAYEQAEKSNKKAEVIIMKKIKTVKEVIYCIPTEKGVHSFYVRVDGVDYYLFSQPYRKGVQDYYGKGVLFNQSIRYDKSHHDCALIKTMDKIPMYVRYVEKEYGHQVMEKMKKRNNVSYGKCA
ncbi:MAG: hypothetical protein K6D02_06850 [Lachnospiraceae bacterium]|nr:hypothetical protein [Lachnospiraceae bacterium]